MAPSRCVLGSTSAPAWGSATHALSTVTVEGDAAAGATYWGIERWPALLALRGDPENAARLLGWSDAMGARLKMPRGPLSQKIHERLQVRLAAQLTADRLRALMAEGERFVDEEVRRIVRN